jgi:hypothetical protein
MMTNNRTEIATALRGLTHETYYNEEIVDNICDAINIADPTNTFRTPEDIYNLLADLIDPTCYLECIETTPKGAEEWELDWEWQCSNCGKNLTDRYDDLDIKTPEELGLLRCPHCGSRIIGTRSGTK